MKFARMRQRSSMPRPARFLGPALRHRRWVGLLYFRYARVLSGWSAFKLEPAVLCGTREMTRPANLIFI
jgi:hypothetical protein